MGDRQFIASFNVRFSEPVRSFDPSALAFASSSAAVGVVTPIPLSATEFSVLVTIGGTGTVVLSQGSLSGVQDMAGNALAPFAATATACSAGSALIGGVCSLCPIGRFSPVTGSRNCTQCPPFTSTDGAGSVFETSCRCDRGYSNRQGTCKPCLPGPLIQLSCLCAEFARVNSL